MKEQEIMKKLFDLRFYKTGWRVSVGPFFLLTNRQDNYSEFTIGRITSSDFRLVGGKTWKEWRKR